jgi:hypothetical protein
MDSSSILTPPRLGDIWPGEGGVYVGLMRGNGQQWHVIVPTDAKAFLPEVAWGGYGQDEPGATSDQDGLANTIALVQSKHEHPAAEWAAGLEIDGHRDLYLPARHECRLAWLIAPELFEARWHWSSTQYSRDNAWGLYFGDGLQLSNDGSWQGGAARAFRRLPA